MLTENSISSNIYLKTRQNLDIKKYKNMNPEKLSKDELLKVCREFESLFINQIFKSMRKTVQKSGWLDGGLKQEIFEDMLYEEYSKAIAHSGGIGLGDMVYKFLLLESKTKV